MRRFNLVTENGENGDSLGVTFFRGTREEVHRGVFQSAAELETMWNSPDHALVQDETGWQGTVGELHEHFRTCHRADLEELQRRGWGNRFESGLNWQTSVNADGDTFTTR